MKSVREASLAALAISACFSPNAPLGVPCADNGDCPNGQECDPVEMICTLPTELRELRDDTAADFAAGAYLDEVTIETQGFIGPAAYFTGGVRIAGIATHAIPDSSTTFDDIVANPIVATSTARGLAVFLGSVPTGVGLPNADNVTVIFEGEIDLDATGTWRFELNANEIGFFEIAPPGTNDFERVVSDLGQMDSIGSITVNTTGWHRFRGAVANDSGAISIEVRVDAPNVTGMFRDFPVDQIRARVGDLEGLLVDGFDEPNLLTPNQSMLFTQSLADLNYDATPFGLPVGNSAYTLRWNGQVLIDVEGDYSFRIDSNDGHRMWLDGQLVADRFSPTTNEISTTTPIRLTPGWHDIVLDTHRSGGAAGRISFTVASGPALVGESFPNDHLRPVIGRAARWYGDADLANLAIPDGMSATQQFSFLLPSGFVPQRAHCGFTITHPVLAQMSVVLDPPSGSNITLLAAGSQMGAGGFSRDQPLSTSTSGESWSFIVADNLVDTNVGELLEALVTIVGDGGTPPFERRYRYESKVHELGNVAALDVLTWGLRQDSATETASLQVRSCDDPAGCASEPWTDVAFGTVPTVGVRRHLQYAVDVTTNGDIPTAVDFVSLSYSAFVEP